MPCYVRALICILLQLHCVLAGEGNNFYKPSFVPYCAIKEECQTDCSCEGRTGCDLVEINDLYRYLYTKDINTLRQMQTMGEPEPSGMTMLEYDMELEEISICSARRCENKYSTCFTTPTFPETSQSVSMPLRKGPLPFGGVYRWMGEGYNISAQTLSNFPAGAEGARIHGFAQLFSDRILKVGCVRADSKDESTIIMCTYGPRGPIPGEPIYRIGPVCSTCPEGYACDYKGRYSRLCKKIKMPHSLATSMATTPPAPPPLPAVASVTPPQPPPRARSPLTTKPLTAPPKPPPFQPIPSCPPNFPPPKSSPKVPPTPPSRRPHVSPSTMFQ